MSWIILSGNKRVGFCVNNGYKDNIQKRERKSLGVDEKMIGWGIITNYKDVGNHGKGAMHFFTGVDGPSIVVLIHHRHRCYR